MTVDTLIGDEIKLQFGTTTFGKRADMGARMRPFMCSGNLKQVFTRLLLGHAELVFGKPAFDTFNRGRGRKPAAFVFAVKGDANLDPALPVKVKFEAGRISEISQTSIIRRRIFGIFDEYVDVTFSAKALADQLFEIADGCRVVKLYVLDVNKVFALIKNVNLGHFSFSGELKSEAPLPFYVPSNG
ncbi:hypothetical protein [Roseovarius pelagicus]|uniref:hypothetical protein n=1 Tax=Roseovarius pelagicus TaxID=2980108 RepID=UPI0021D6499C|nr:hypothetical protein [Roseovarius pelagicus]